MGGGGGGPTSACRAPVSQHCGKGAAGHDRAAPGAHTRNTPQWPSWGWRGHSAIRGEPGATLIALSCVMLPSRPVNRTLSRQADLAESNRGLRGEGVNLGVKAQPEVKAQPDTIERLLVRAAVRVAGARTDAARRPPAAHSRPSCQAELTPCAHVRCVCPHTCTCRLQACWCPAGPLTSSALPAGSFLCRTQAPPHRAPLSRPFPLRGGGAAWAPPHQTPLTLAALWSPPRRPRARACCRRATTWTWRSRRACSPT